MRTPAAWLFFLALLLPFGAQGEVLRLCNIEIESPEEISFSSTEETWLCGDPQTAAWRSIPANQQRMFLKSFLQARGYISPKFQYINDVLYVESGPITETIRFGVVGAPPGWNWAKRWQVKGRPLTPELLDELTNWAKRELRYRGYPCPKVSARALVNLGELRLELEPGEPYYFGPVENQGTSDLDAAILERYTAFNTGQLFDIRLLELTSSRILQEDLYLSTYYDVLCSADQKATIVRRFVPAKPRLFTVGVGFDSDRGPLAQTQMRWARLSRSANSLDLQLYASFREQSLSSRFHYYFPADLSSRLRLVPTISVKREVEEFFSTLTSQAGASLANSWEMDSFQLAAELGPYLQRVNRRRGDGPKRVDTFRIAGKVSAMSHLFEYYMTNPKEGWMVSLDTSSQFPGVLSQQSVHRVFFQHQTLWNLGNWDPAVIILGWRGYFGSYLLNQNQEDPPDIPVNQKFFLGGDQDIRGFSRKELPGNRNGFLTVIYQGIELRTGTWFPWNMQPFVFFDIAKGGLRARHIANPTYLAPGLGVRYNSPIGSMRLSLGRGFVGNPAESDPPPHWQVFFSLGKEF